MWQPIETAPMDQFLLLCGPSGYTTTPMEVTTGRMCSDYHAGRWIDHANDDLTDWGFEPTHWMPLPERPGAQPAESIKDDIIDDLQSQFDTEGITEHDSGDALIRLSDAIAAVEDNFAQPAPSVPEGWLRAIDEALVVAHIGVANESDTFEQAREKLDNLIGFHVDVATDPVVNGGWKLVPIEPMPSMPKLHVGYLPTLNQDGYPALGTWWVQLWDGDDVFARVYGSSPEEAHNRAEMLAAAPEAKPCP